MDSLHVLRPQIIHLVPFSDSCTKSTVPVPGSLPPRSSIDESSFKVMHDSNNIEPRCEIFGRGGFEIDDDLVGILWRCSRIYAATLGIGLKGDQFQRVE